MWVFIAMRLKQAFVIKQNEKCNARLLKTDAPPFRKGNIADLLPCPRPCIQPYAHFEEVQTKEKP